MGIILVILFLLALYVVQKENSFWLEWLSHYVSYEKGKIILLALPFIIATILGFLPEIFGEDLKGLIFRLKENKEEEKPKEEKQPIIIQNIIPEQTQPIRSLVSKIPAEKIEDKSKFYPNDFIPDLTYFVGREDLFVNIEKELKTSHRVSIHDISGLGKTFSTLEFARRNQAKYDKLFFINASKETYLESLAECGVLLDKSVANTQEQLVKANAFKNWLEKNDNWLVIFDNVDVAQDIFPFVPNNKKGDCLFTSNFRDVINLGKDVKIEKLNVEESKTLLFSKAKTEPQQEPTFIDQAEKDSFNKIIDEIDGLPISLSTTGAFIAKKQLSFAEYLERLADEPEIILDAEDNFGTYHKKSALKAFSIAFEANTETKGLDARQKESTEAVKTLYSVVSFLYPEDIHEEFLRKYLEKEYERLGKAPFNNAFWQDVRAKLTEYDLLKWNPHNKTFWTHRLIQKTIQTKLNTAEKETICHNVLTLLGDFFPEYDYNNKESCERYYQHTIFALENADKLFNSEDSKSLYYRIARYQRLLGNYPLAESYYQRSLEISNIVFGKEHNETATSLNNLALVYDDQGKYDEAIKLYQEVIKIYRRELGIDHPWVATSLNNLANVYKAQGKYDEAIKLCQEALEIDKKTIGIEHPDYATDLNNLALVYKNQGKYNEAIQLFQDVIKIYKKELGNKHPWVAISLNNLALVYDAQTKYQEALPLYEEALQILEAKLPETHPDIQIVRNHLRNCQEKLGIKDE